MTEFVFYRRRPEAADKTMYLGGTCRKDELNESLFEAGHLPLPDDVTVTVEELHGADTALVEFPPYFRNGYAYLAKHRFKLEDLKDWSDDPDRFFDTCMRQMLHGYGSGRRFSLDTSRFSLENWYWATRDSESIAYDSAPMDYPNATQIRLGARSALSQLARLTDCAETLRETIDDRFNRLHDERKKKRAATKARGGGEVARYGRRQEGAVVLLRRPLTYTNGEAHILFTLQTRLKIKKSQLAFCLPTGRPYGGKIGQSQPVCPQLIEDWSIDPIIAYLALTAKAAFDAHRTKDARRAVLALAQFSQERENYRARALEALDVLRSNPPKAAVYRRDRLHDAAQSILTCWPGVHDALGADRHLFVDTFSPLPS